MTNVIGQLTWKACDTCAHLTVGGLACSIEHSTLIENMEFYSGANLTCGKYQKQNIPSYVLDSKNVEPDCATEANQFFHAAEMLDVIEESTNDLAMLDVAFQTPKGLRYMALWEALAVWYEFIYGVEYPAHMSWLSV